MYVPPLFKTGRDTALQFAAARGFGTLIAVDGTRPVAVHVPFVMTSSTGESATLECHVARPNPIHKLIAANTEVLLTVEGPDAYISPDWYVSEDQVPTWNYVSVHMGGHAKILPVDQTLAHVDRLSARFEADLLPKTPWLTAKMTDNRLRAMLNAIVVIEMTVTLVEASWKLSQNKPAADRDGVRAKLRARGGWRDSAIAQLMDETPAT